MRDIGSGVNHRSGSVIRWMQEDSFEYCCEIAMMDPGWCRELLKSILLLPEQTRRDITRTCMNMIEYIEPLMSIDKKSNEIRHDLGVYGIYNDAEPSVFVSDAPQSLKDKADKQIKLNQIKKKTYRVK